MNLKKICDTFMAVSVAALAAIVLILVTVDSMKPKILSREDAYNIFKSLVRVTDMPHVIPNMIIVKNSQINAFASTSSIVLYTGMLEFVQSESELAAILGHEIAHVMQDHLVLLNSHEVDPRALELNADKMGVALMLRAGYNVCAAREVWARMRTVNGGNPLTYTHPSYSDRYYALSYPQCERY